MLISGFVKNSFVDYPGKMASVIFLPRCNMSCPWCHNKHILSGDFPIVAEEEIFAFLESRVGLLDGVVVTGGEPTLSGGLDAFLVKIRALGYAVKLDTNGTRPEVLRPLIERKLVDRFAMDIKGPLDKYKFLCGFGDTDKIVESINLIKNSGAEYEFRTTYEPRLTPDDIYEICKVIFPMDATYYLQQYRQVDGCKPPHPNSIIKNTADKVNELYGSCVARGI